MKKLLLLPFLLLALPASAQITAGTGTNFTGGTYSGSSFGGNVAPSGANTLVLCGVKQYASGADNATAATLDGNAMTRVAGVPICASSQYATIYALAVGTSSGSNLPFAVTVSGATEMYGMCVPYYGAKQTSNPEASAVDCIGGASLTGTVTVATDQAWVAMFGTSGGGISADTGATLRLAGEFDVSAWFDSNGPLGTGSQSMTYTGSSPMGEITVSIAPAAGGGSGSPACSGLLLGVGC